MGFFSWVILVLLIAPMVVVAGVELFKTAVTVSDDSRTYSGLRIIIEFSVAAILIIWSIIDISNGIFSSLKMVCFFGIKALIMEYLFFAGIKHLILKLHKDSWNKKINTVLNGQLGKEMKKYLHNDSYEYVVYNDRIVFDKEGESYRLEFADLGYREIPADSADAICGWIRDNVVIHPNLYRIECEQKKEEHTEYTPGNRSEGYTVTRNYSGGYNVEYYSGDLGSEHTTTTYVTVAYKLTRKPYERVVTRAELKKW